MKKNEKSSHLDLKFKIKNSSNPFLQGGGEKRKMRKP
jgi:hypothetical protein